SANIAPRHQKLLLRVFSDVTGGTYAPATVKAAPEAPPMRRETRRSHNQGEMAVTKKLSPRPKIETRRTARRPKRSLKAPRKGAEKNCASPKDPRRSPYQ